MAALVAGERARMYALGGVARGGATRGGYHSPKLFVAINGVHYATARAVASQRVKNDTLTITNAAPNRCSFEIRGVVPAIGAEVVVTMGTKNTLTREFAGNVLNRTMSIVGTPANPACHVNAIDFSWALNSRKVSGRWTNTSGTVIAQALMANAPGYTAVHVEAGLPVLDEFTVTNLDLSAALAQLAKRLSVSVNYIDFFRDLHLATSEPMLTNPRPLVDGDTPLLDAIAVIFDGSQFVSRVRVEGGGVNVLTDVVPGETILPVDDVAWYEVAGGLVASGPQRLTYTGVQAGGGGSLVGPGATPSTAPTVYPAVGTGLADGVYQYGYTDVTAAGESLPSPLATITAETIQPPPAFTLTDLGPDVSSTMAAGTYSFGMTYVPVASNGVIIPGAETTSSPTASITVAAGHLVRLTYGLGRAGTNRNIYRTTSGGAQLKFWATDPINGSTSAVVAQSDASLGANIPTVSTAVMNQVVLSGIALGATGTTQRKLYRTVANGSQLKLQQTIANNTATTGVQDATADGSLGANVPTSDTSGLTQPSGQVNAGSTSLPTASPAPFLSGGGWVILGGSRAVRYTGVTGNALTGIPASGAGALLTTVLYGTQVIPAPALTGIPASGAGSIAYLIKRGDPVNLVVQVDDAAAQALLAALLSTATYTHDGIVEDYVIDNRLSSTEARARAQAQLALRNQIDVSAQLHSRDMNMRLGRTQAITLASLEVDQSFKVQTVTVSGYTPSRPPHYDATLSSDLFSFEDLLRMARKDVR